MTLLSFLQFQLRIGTTREDVDMDDFFKEAIVTNLAALLGIDSSRIRFVDVVSSKDGSLRKRRDVTDVTFIEVKLLSLRRKLNCF